MDKPDQGSIEGLGRRDMLKLAGAAVVGIGGVALASSPVMGASVGGGGGVHHFSLSATGIATFFFAELVELRMASERSEDGHVEPPFEVVFKTGLLGTDIYTWFTSASGGRKAGKRSGQIIGYDDTGVALVKWNLTGAYPSEILASSSSSQLVYRVTLTTDLITPA